MNCRPGRCPWSARHVNPRIILDDNTGTEAMSRTGQVTLPSPTRHVTVQRRGHPSSVTSLDSNSARPTYGVSRSLSTHESERIKTDVVRSTRPEQHDFPCSWHGSLQLSATLRKLIAP